MKKALLLVTVILLVSLTAGFPASLTTIDRTASPDSPAKFQVDIQNNHSERESFRVSPRAGNRDWFFNDGPITLDPSENGTINITVTPSSDAFQHNWEFDLRIWMAGTNNYQRLSSYYRVERRAELNVVSTALEKNSVRPGEQNRINVTVRNLGSEALSDYSFRLDYNNTTEDRSGETLLHGTEQRMPDQKTYEFTLPVEENALPGERTANLTVFHEGELQENYSFSFNVERVENVVRGQNSSETVLGFSKSMYADNRGNTEAEAVFDETVPVYVTPFMAYSAEQDRTETNRGSVTYYWNYTLAPGEKALVDYRLNYWMPALIVLLIAAGLILLKRLGGTVTLQKTATVQDGAVKVRIRVRSRSDSMIDEIKVFDFIPDIASLHQNFDMARPKIRRKNEGTELEWFIEDLKPGEERILEYRIEPKVEVEGGVTLEAAEARKDGEKVATSSRPSVDFRPE